MLPRNALRLSLCHFSPFLECLKAPIGEGGFILSFQDMFTLHILQYGHLLDGYLVEFLQTLALRHTFMDKDRI
jgi:hypothetical protein